MTLCIIPARSGSKRLPGKNWLTVGGKTLVQRAVDCALGAGLKPYIVTDAPERCEGLGAVVLEEPEWVAGDTVSMAGVIRWATDFRVCPKDGRVVLLQPTSPLRSPEDVTACIRIMDRTDCDYVVSVTAYTHNDQCRDGSAVEKTLHPYQRNGAVYVARLPDLFTGWTQLYVMPPERSVDIDTAEDLEEARRIAGP